MTSHLTTSPSQNFGLRATAIAQTFLVAGAANAQTNAAVEDTDAVELDPFAVKGDNFALSSPKFTVALRDTPQTINVIPEEILEAQGATSLQDVLRNSPGITFRAGEGGAAPGDNLFVRGFSAANDIFVNGVRDRGEYSRDAYNLEQVEVSKGPASATYGRGSTGGSVNLVTKQANLSESDSLSLSLGTHNHKRLVFDTNSVLDKENGIAFRLTGMATDEDVPGRDFVYKRAWALNPSLSFGLGKDTQVTLSYEKLKQDDMADFGMWTGLFGNPQVSYSNFYGYPDRDFSEVDNDRATLSIGHNFANGLTLRNVSSHYTSKTDAIYTAPAGPNDSTTEGYIRTSDKAKDKYNENLANHTTLSGSFRVGELTHSFSTGIELNRETADNFSHHSISPDPERNAIDPYSDGPFTFTPNERSGRVRSGTSDTISLYAFDTLSIGEKWQANAGLRWESFDSDYLDSTNGVATSELSQKEEMTSYRFGLVYKPLREGSLYFGAGNSFNPTAENFSLSDSETSSSNVNLDPEETKTLELGTKWDLFESRASFAAAVFQSEKHNARASLGGRGTEYTNLGKQSVEGFELGLSGKITDRLSVFGGYSQLDTEITDSPNLDEIGTELSYSPSESFNLWLDYQATPKLSFGGGATYSGSQAYSSSVEAPDDASYWLMDLTASYVLNDRLSFRLNVDNAADERYIERGSSNRSVPGASRSAKLSAYYKF
ncbi:TonB-dependent siderophore receptor [Pelagicoccus sp. NFK12]|uniref:TonB-dependent siderophore receptor n=1 Tax=Pelagicoccus enzymogenes TaxID=2773457 RepID=A0A927IIZ9_9BACT|nr:TonB-dependent siderophore receptor [Pelagicoccus enzymogenes]MBD5781786.1 TonB-dependent siderophore receptor [Pelagicoccus enzymogenes]